MPETPPSPEVVSLRFPSRLELLNLLDRVSTLLCGRAQVDEDTASQVALSVIEAGTTAIQHGHRRDASKPVEVRFLIYGDRIEVEVRDTGAGFDLAAVNGNVTSADHLLEARGRGIFIMRACMDSVDYEFTANGTVCHLVKRFPAKPAAGR